MSFPDNLRFATRFTVTDEHLALLRRMFIDHNDYLELGAPSVNAKRPYGNSGIYGDLVEILDIQPEEIDEDGDPRLSETQQQRLDQVHHEMTIALQILTNDLSIETGTYTRPDPYDALGWVKETR